MISKEWQTGVDRRLDSVNKRLDNIESSVSKISGSVATISGATTQIAAQLNTKADKNNGRTSIVPAALKVFPKRWRLVALLALGGGGTATGPARTSHQVSSRGCESAYRFKAHGVQGDAGIPNGMLRRPKRVRLEDACAFAAAVESW